MDNFTTTTQHIIELLETVKTAYNFKVIFDGDPIWIPTSNLPCIVVVKTDGTTEVGPTGMDRVTENISIRVVTNMNDFMGASAKKNVPHKWISDVVEARDANGLYLPDTIMGVLRQNYTLSNSIVDQKFTAHYDLLIENRTSDGTVTLEGHLNFATQMLISVPARV